MTKCLLTDLDMEKCFISKGITEQITETKNNFTVEIFITSAHLKNKLKNSKIQVTRKTISKKYYRQRLMSLIIKGLLKITIDTNSNREMA